MCEEERDYGQLLEEYRGMIQKLFSMTIELNEGKVSEMTRLKIENDKLKQLVHMKNMREAMKDG